MDKFDNGAPFSKAFNAAVLAMANRCFPTGFDVSDTLDVRSLDDLRAAIKANNGRMIVWAGASEDTIYGDAEVNYAARAWHDWCRLQNGFQFTLDGEQAAARVQMGHVRTLFGNNPVTRHWQWLIHCEAVEQARHLRDLGCFPERQRDFTRETLAKAGDTEGYTTGFIAMAGLGAWHDAAWLVGDSNAHAPWARTLDPYSLPPVVPEALDQTTERQQRRLEVGAWAL